MQDRNTRDYFPEIIINFLDPEYFGMRFAYELAQSFQPALAQIKKSS